MIFFEGKFEGKKVALHFSGGKDSIACLYLLKRYWHLITVVWVNTGAAYPKTIEQMEVIKKTVPHFLEVKSDQPSQIELKGYPSDVISSWDTPLGRLIDESRKKKMQAPFDCCSENLWMPMYQAMKEHGFTMIIRGQRNSEKKKSPIRSGHIEDGIEYFFPIQEWTDADVHKYLHDNGIVIPDYYHHFNDSLDCWSCTAYLSENGKKMKYLKEKHPQLYEKYQIALSENIAIVENELDKLKGVLNG